MWRHFLGKTLRFADKSCSLGTVRWASSTSQILRPTEKTIVKPSQTSIHSAAPTHAITDESPEEETMDYMQHADFFEVRDLVRLDELFAAKAHLGHKNGTRNNFMIPYIFGNRLGIDIIDLEQTVPMFQDALNFLAHIAFRSGVFLFITRHKQSVTLVEECARKLNEFAHCREWREGNFVNSFVKFRTVIRMPDVIVFLSTNSAAFQQHPAVIEAAKLGVPTVGIVDTSNDPRLITYPIPGNDDSMSAIELYCRLISKAVEAGKTKRKQYMDETDFD